MRRRWSPQSRVLLGLSVVLAVVAYALAQGWAARVRALDPGDDVIALVAARDLARGAALTPDDVRTEPVPRGFLPPGAITSLRPVAGTRTLSPILSGEVLTRQRLTTAAGPTAALVPDGLRAVLVASTFPAGSVAEGDRVDVIATYDGAQPYTDTVAEGLEVLALVEGVESAGTGMILLTDPAGAERIAHARTFAQLEVTVLGVGA